MKTLEKYCKSKMNFMAIVYVALIVVAITLKHSA